MKRSTRYLFIGLGALFFLIAAPLMVFYVGGIRYNFSDNEYDKTGILSIVTDPKKVEVSLDGVAKDSTPADLRFLSPKEYTITLTKEGYWDWTKRLEVKAGKATIASGGLDKIYLLRRGSAAETVADKVLDYTVDSSQLVYLTDLSVNLIKDNALNSRKTLAVTGQPYALRPSPHGNFVLILGRQKTFVVDVSNWRLTDITSQAASNDDLQITDNGQALIQTDGSLVSLEPTSKKVTPLLTGIGAFTTLGQNLYYIQTADSQRRLAVVPLAEADHATPQVLLNDLATNLNVSRILITEQKDLLLYANGNLYKVNQKLDLIAENIQQLYFDSVKSVLLYATSSELSWYEFIANKAHLITRNTQAMVSPQLDPNVGYAFYIQNNMAQAMELDDRDHQNNYPLLEVKEGRSIRLTTDHKTLFILDGQQLKMLTFR